jgi:CRISPR/Cas system-associated exonuclease Cas4 (RecB family)
MSQKEKIEALRSATKRYAPIIPTEESYLVADPACPFPDGYARVTHVLSSCGLGFHFNGSAARRERALNRGSLVHMACQNLADLDRENTSEEIVKSAETYERFLSESGFEPILTEHTMFSDKWGIAGTADVIGLLSGKVTVLDIKTGTVYPAGKPHPAYIVQVAAYTILFEEEFGFAPNAAAIVNVSDKRYVLHLFRMSDELFRQAREAAAGAFSVWQWIKTVKS